MINDFLLNMFQDPIIEEIQEHRWEVIGHGGTFTTSNSNNCFDILPDFYEKTNI